MITTSSPKRFATRVPWLVAAGLLLATAAPALGATSAQQVYETPETGQTPSPLPNLPSIPPAGDVQPFTPQAIPGPVAQGPLVAGSVGPAPDDGTAVRPPVTPGPGGSTPAGEVASEPGPVPAAGAPGTVLASGGSGTLPVTGLDVLIVLAAAAAAAGVGFSLRKAAR